MGTMRIDISRCQQGCGVDVVSLSVAPGVGVVDAFQEFKFGFTLWGGCGGPYSLGYAVDHRGLIGLRKHKNWSATFKARVQKEIEQRVAEVVKSKWCTIDEAEKFLSEVYGDN